MPHDRHHQRRRDARRRGGSTALVAWLARLALLLLGFPAAAACVVSERGRVPVELAGGAILVAAEINGRPARLVLDTGAQRSVVTPEAVGRLGLALDEWVATTMRGVGGIERRRNALPRSFTLGGIRLERRTTTRDTSLTVATLALGNGIDGLLGRDFLAPFDLALDLTARSLALFEVRDCAGAFLPWTAPYTALTVQNPTDSALSVLVELDGVKLRALLDTGASATLLAAPGMARLGLSLGAADRRITGLGGRSVGAEARRFRILLVGPDVIEAPTLLVAPIRVVPVSDMLLGADWLAGRRVWISFATKQVFVARP
jgi:hypothetical protein